MTARVSAIVLIALTAACSAWGQIRVTAPASNVAVAAADDYATQIFQDPWDMSQRTDLGWYTFGIDQPPVNLLNPTVANGIFSATSSTGNPNFWLLDSGNPEAAPVGKIGSLFPIDSTKYRRFLIRMNLSGGGVSPNPPCCAQSAQILWSNNTIYQTGGLSASGAFFTYPGWWIYSVDIPSLPLAVGPATWTAKPVDSLRFNPVALTGVNISVDWARLVSDNAALNQTITWTGSGAVDIYLDNDTNLGNGVAGQIAHNASGTTFQFYAGGLQAGTYYPVVCPANSSTGCSYATGAWIVGGTPTLTFTAPNPEGSTDDFATVQLNNPWDFDALTDADKIFQAQNVSIKTIPAEDEAGNSLGSVRVLYGTSLSGTGSGDTAIYTLFWTVRGATYRIDTSRYRILTVRSGVKAARDINNGSIARIIWRVNGDALENVSNDIVTNSLPNVNVIQKIVTDMKTLMLETGSGSPSRTGWTGMVDGFRLKPHEFTPPTDFYYQSAKLAAFERTNSAYNITWNYVNPGPAAPTLSLYYSPNASGFTGTQIAAGLDPATASYSWNTASIPNGTYYIYGVLANGATVVNRYYAAWPVVVDHNLQQQATVSLDRSKLLFGATNNGALPTDPQDVLVNVSGPGAASVSWTVASNQPWIVVLPTSGIGKGKFTVSLSSNALPSPSTLTANITLTATGVSNSPQFVQTTTTVINPASTTGPFGVIDLPKEGDTVFGPIPVTGWALDDIGVAKVDVWRDPVSTDPRAAIASNGLVYISDAYFVADARPDVAAAYSTLPDNYRGGWGMQVLTNFLPDSDGSGGIGNGTIKLHAIAHDKDGHTVELGAKTIHVNNAAANLPFGTIDTPGQGGPASGSNFVNFGWVLTQPPKLIPKDGSTIFVFIDGVSLGHPVYNQYRSDIAGLFPDHLNAQGAVGYWRIDTTLMTNGQHSLGWTVTDNGGNVQGIGSRLFTVFNQGGGATGGEGSGSILETPDSKDSEKIDLRRGFQTTSQLQHLIRSDAGFTVELDQMDRVELHLGGAGIRGWHIVNGEQHSLPIGSTLDERTGIFYWQPPVGFFGNYHLMFQRPGDGTVIPVRIHIGSDVHRHGATADR